MVVRLKLLQKSVEVIAWFDSKGNLIPIRFRYLDDQEGFIKVNVDRVIERHIDKFAGNKILRYKCQTNHGNVLKLFELCYELETCRWYLYKM